MINAPKSCAVAFPSQRNCATLENGSTSTATHYVHVGRKPASIQELRAQLRAQQQRNLAASVHAAKGSKVVHDSASVESCSVALPNDCNNATNLIRKFMEVDGLTLEAAETLAAVSVAPRQPAEWLSLIQEMDDLIDRYCHARRLSDHVRVGITGTRKRQSLASIPLAVDWFRRELKRIKNTP
jgi:hypothetical protein